MRRYIYLIGLLGLSITFSNAQSLKIDNGKVETIPDARGNELLDFSYCGYRNSNVAIPTVQNVVVVKWKAGDNSQRIQKAIDYVSSLKPDIKGFRGAVILENGTYELQNAVYIRTSGVVLRGKEKAKTVLLKKGVDRGSVVYIEGGADYDLINEAIIESPYVAVGKHSFIVDDASHFRKGDNIIVFRESSKEWIHSIGCDIYGGGISSLGWKPGDTDIYWDRTITDIKGNEITVDVPLTYSLDKNMGHSSIVSYSWKKRIENCGLENITLQSDYDRHYPKDENHCWNGVSIDNAVNCWVDNVNFINLAGSAVNLLSGTSNITVEDCISHNPVSEIGGMRRMTFITYGQKNLFQRCVSYHGINDFVAGYSAAGPNAFVQCDAIESNGFSGSVGSNANGLLFDVVNIDGNNLTLKNLGQNKNGAGWNSANSMMWQCTAAELENYSPNNDNINRAYGCWGQFSGNGEWQSSNNHLNPRSLFYAQLSKRLNKDVSQLAYIMPLLTSSTSSPTIEQAEAAIKESLLPRLQLKDWIEKVPYTKNLYTEKIKSVDDIKDVKAVKQQNHLYSILNGHLVCDGKLLTGHRSETPWWNGSLKNSFLPKAKIHVTRFVPGREGIGLTDRIDSVVDYMSKNNILTLDHNYGLWYDRRRDDHERIRRRDGDVWAPFYEQPFARSGEGHAWEGLSKYDLTKPNSWYWSRLSEFAQKASSKGLLLFHENYFQHNILEAGAHWVDCPWRSANNINKTGFSEPVNFSGDKRIFVAEQFYDINNPVRRELHKKYIYQCLDNFKDNDNVIQLIGAEFTGPLHFVQFWIDTIEEWENKTGKHPLIALSVTKDVQDSILADRRRSKIVDIIDIRYWHYKTDGVYEPRGGQNLAPRQHARKMKVGKITFDEAYKAVSEYRSKFPDKAVIYNAQNYPEMAWAVLMAGGSTPDLNIKDETLLKDIAMMNPIDTNNENYRILGKNGTGFIIYSKSNSTILLDIPSGKYTISTINKKTGKIIEIAHSTFIKGETKLNASKGNEVVYWYKKL